MTAITPGRAAYQRCHPGPGAVPWEELSASERAHWEDIARAAVAAYIEANGRDPVDVGSVIAEAAGWHAERKRYRALVAEILREVELGTLGQHTAAATTQTLARTMRWREQAERIGAGITGAGTEYLAAQLAERNAGPAPELAAAMAEPRALRSVIGTLIGLFRPTSYGWTARTSAGRLCRLAETAGVEPPNLAAASRAELDEYAAVRHFTETWRETFTELPDAYMCTYTCAEANAAAELYRALGDEDAAAAIIKAHAAYDEEGDQHYDGEYYEPEGLPAGDPGGLLALNRHPEGGVTETGS